MREMVFISHANPEDNDFTLWLALQLAGEGYPVWCDLTKLLGGEDFWRNIDQAIRQRTTKFLYVLSMTSNSKDGPLQELQVAQNVARDLKLTDFIIPLHIDDLPHREITIQLSRLNAIGFERGWANGLRSLLEKLEQDGVGKDTRFSPAAVSSWWRGQFSADRGVIDQGEEYLSNWFPIISWPDVLYFHELRRTGIGKIEITRELPFPAFQHDRYLVSFANADDFVGKLDPQMSLGDSYPLSLSGALNGNEPDWSIDRKQGREFVVRLLRQAWEHFLRDHKLPSYLLANGPSAFYFSKDLVTNDTVSFQGVEGKRSHRQVVGYKSVGQRGEMPRGKRYWHFGLQWQPMVYPSAAYAVKPIVVFSDDGAELWANKERMHKARRGQCKNWWNAEWRDRILASISWLAGGADSVTLRVGSGQLIEVSAQPVMFRSPVSYLEPEKEMTSVDDRAHDDDDDDEDARDEVEIDEDVEEDEGNG